MTNIFATANADAFKAATAAERAAQKALREARDAHNAAARIVEFIRAVHADSFAYHKVDSFQGKPSAVLIYRTDAESPTGVVCAGSAPYAEGMALLQGAGRI